MAKRDVQLVIRAKSEADRAIDSISSALRTLTTVQNEVSGSADRTGDTMQRLSSVFGTLDSAFAKIDQAVAKSTQSFTAQQTSLAENQAQYRSLQTQINAAQQAIINTRIAMQNDGSLELRSRLTAAQQGYRDLVSQAGRLETKLVAQRSDVVASAEAHQGLTSAATAAQIAMGKMGDAGERENLRTAAAAREATTALRAKAAQIAEEVAQRRLLESNQGAVNAQLGVKNFDTGAARASAAVFEEDARAKRDAAIATDELSAAANRLRARARPVAAEQQKINAQMREARALYAAGKISVRDYTAEMGRLSTQLKQTKNVQAGLQRNGSNEIKGLLGLRPYEIQNLSYQINDLFTQIASGAPVSQAFAQQGGQIVQIFPKFLGFILKYAKGLGLVAVALTPVIIGMSRLNDLAETSRTFETALRASADGARYNTEALSENVDAMDKYGASVEDARAAVKTFLAEGINPDLIDEMGRATQNLADITGTNLTDAAESVAKAFSGGYKELAEFDDKMNFLTLSEREQIRAMFDSGQESDARALAFARFYDMAEQGARETETAWSRMTDAMAGAWADFADYLAGADIFGPLRREMNAMAIGATYLINRIRGANHEAAALDALGKKRINGANAGEAPKLVADPLDTGSARARKLKSDEAYEAAKRKKSGSKKSGKSEAEYQADFNKEIKLANEERQRQAEYIQRTNVLSGETLIKEQRRQAVAEAVLDAEQKATKNSKRKLVLTQAQRDEIARTVGLEFDAKNAKALAQAAQKEHEQKINNLMAKRRELLEAIEFASPGSEDFKNLQTATLGVNLQLESATAEATAFWKAVAGNPEQMALLGLTTEQVQNMISALQNDVKTLKQDAIEAAQARAEAGIDELTNMQRLLQEQIEFAQLNGEAGRSGQLQKQLVEVNERLTEGATKALEFWRAVRGSPEELALLGLTPAAVDNIILGFENTISAAERLRTQFLKTGEALNRDLADGGVTAMEQFAQSIVNGENVLGSFARAFLSFASDFLLQIARMIAQQAIFNALSGGSPGGAGGAGGFLSAAIGSLFHGGGVVAKGGRGRNVPAMMFANATRYHGGGIAGLKADEVPAILRKGEEVLTGADARHRRNGGGKGGAGMSLSQILVLTPEQLAEAMASAAGKEVFMTWIRTERATINQELGNN